MVTNKKIMLNLGIDPSFKREPIFEENGLWIDILPKKIVDSKVNETDKPVNGTDKPINGTDNSILELPLSNLLEPLLQSDKHLSLISALERNLHELKEELRIERSKREKLKEKLKALKQKNEGDLEQRVQERVAQTLKDKKWHEKEFASI